MRQFLRYPLTREFLKYVADDHEWAVITDSRLRPIIAKRGGRRVIDSNVVTQVFKELIEKKPKDTIIKVYFHHTHPGSRSVIPSTFDVQSDVYYKLNKEKELSKHGIIVLGYGIITKSGIGILKYPEERIKLEIASFIFGLLYNLRAATHIKKALDRHGIPHGDYEYGYMPKQQEQRFTEIGKNSAFKSIVRESHDIVKHKTVRKNRFGRISRRRGR